MAYDLSYHAHFKKLIDATMSETGHLGAFHITSDLGAIRYESAQQGLHDRFKAVKVCIDQ